MSLENVTISYQNRLDESPGRYVVIFEGPTGWESDITKQEIIVLFDKAKHETLQRVQQRKAFINIETARNLLASGQITQEIFDLLTE